jgi:proteic killer suppression protein
MIKTSRDKDTESIFRRERVERFSIQIQKLVQRKLDLLDGADAVEDLRIPPGTRLEKLSGNRRGQYSIRVNDRWQICFCWKSGQATDVEIVDYH